jgi:hypothetical protein
MVNGVPSRPIVAPTHREPTKVANPRFVRDGDDFRRTLDVIVFRGQASPCGRDAERLEAIARHGERRHVREPSVEVDRGIRRQEPAQALEFTRVAKRADHDRDQRSLLPASIDALHTDQPLRIVNRQRAQERASASVNIAVFAPMPSASETIAARENPGLRQSCRQANESDGTKADYTEDQR